MKIMSILSSNLSRLSNQIPIQYWGGIADRLSQDFVVPPDKGHGLSTLKVLSELYRNVETRLRNRKIDTNIQSRSKGLYTHS
jgi:hypothetical protein